MDASTQTDADVHDIYYYKNRAYKAEEAYLSLIRLNYTDKLNADLAELEKETRSKIQLYSYNQEKIQQFLHEFQAATNRTDILKEKAMEVFNFNIRSLKDGHELNELPRIDDPNVEVENLTLGPVTPTIPMKGEHMLPPFRPGSMMMNGGGPFAPMNRFQAPPQSPFYSFYRDQSDNMMPVNLNPITPGPASGSSHPPHFNLPIGSNRPFAATTTEMSNLDMNDRRSEQILRLLSIDEKPSGSNSSHMTANGSSASISDSVFAALNSAHSNGGMSSAAPSNPLSASISSISKQSDSNLMSPSGVSASNAVGHHSPPASHVQSGYMNQPDLGSMGLDHLDYNSLDYNPTPGEAAAVKSKSHGQQKWSQIAASGTDASSASLVDGEWQAVGSKKTRPVSAAKVQPSSSALPKAQTALSNLLALNPIMDIAAESEGANFERVVEAMMEKYHQTRPEVIAVLQKVRHDRNGDMNIPLPELVREAEKLFAQNKNILKPTSLTARARAVGDHQEPCDNQLCPARLKLLKYRTELCLSYQTTGSCHMKPGTCVYAHGEAELRPLPKDELCERYLEGKCSNKRCVYAHGAAELKNRPIVNPAEYLKAKSKKQAAINGNNNNKPGSDELTLSAADKDPSGEECSICFETMSKKSRKKLDCGHDAFHYKCLKRWVAGEGDRSCPLCRSNTLLPEEYPALGSR